MATFSRGKGVHYTLLEIQNTSLIRKKSDNYDSKKTQFNFTARSVTETKKKKSPVGKGMIMLVH